MLYAKVLIDIANANVDRLFTYCYSEEELSVLRGQRVLVPFGAGNKKTEGFVLEISDSSEIQNVQIKRIIKTLEPFAVLKADQIDLAYWMKDKYKCLLSQALRLMIPAQLRGGRIKEKTEPLVMISEDIDIEEVKKSLVSKNGTVKSPKQLEILDLLSQVNAKMSVKDISSFIPNANSAITALLKKGVIVKSDHVLFRDPYADLNVIATAPLALNEEQSAAYDAICKGIDEKKGIFLLHGVTGSGKTEVYLQAIAKVINEGKRAILLVPEISLTPQTVERIKGRFSGRIAVLHSRLSHGERYDEWRRILLKKADVVVGARSAVFAPTEDLGLIIIDEEHEPSYASEQTPRYNACDIAIKRAKLSGACVVLGSATPKIESYMKAQHGKYTLLTMKNRAKAHNMPKVSIVDMREEFKNGNNSIFSLELVSEMKRCFEANEQAILFLNRRGYSTFVSCRSCGHVFKCKNCDVSLVYHKYGGRMKCHYCSHSEALPKKCPECSSPYIKCFGVGTQQVEEQVKELFPNVKTLRMDMDTTRTKNAHHDILNRFYNGEAQVLIGTQMIAKGLDIKNVTLVGVVAADASLFHSDYRSSERTFQLLTQVAGRAGRDSETSNGGSVIIQTYCPDHSAVVAASKHDYEGFYKVETSIRRSSMFPPYSLFYRLLFVGENEDMLEEKSQKYLIALEKVIKEALIKQGANIGELMLMYSSPAPIKRREGLYRYVVMIKLARTKNTSAVLDAVHAYLEEHPCEMLVSAQINPNDMI